MRTLSGTLIFVLLEVASLAQTKTPPAKIVPGDRLGLTCSELLKMSSQDWILYYNEKTHQYGENNPRGVLTAIAVYGRCYDARTDRLVASLAKAGKGPRVAALKDFLAFDQRLKDFASKALAMKQAPPGSQQFAYAMLYQKQFRYRFYQSYEQKPPNAAPAKSALTAPSRATAGSQAPDDAAEFGKVKNHFGELLGNLPDDQRREIHAAFGQLLLNSSLAQDFKLNLYGYAIFLVESDPAKPFGPPPF
jgi:hypothetical protein